MRLNIHCTAQKSQTQMCDTHTYSNGRVETSVFNIQWKSMPWWWTVTKPHIDWDFKIREKMCHSEKSTNLDRELFQSVVSFGVNMWTGLTLECGIFYASSLTFSLSGVEAVYWHRKHLTVFAFERIRFEKLWFQKCSLLDLVPIHWTSKFLGFQRPLTRV